MIKIQQADIYGWPGYRISCEELSLGLVPSLGGRVLSLQFQNEELFYVHPEDRTGLKDLISTTDLRAFKKQFGFRLWGGDKVWVAPEKDWWEKGPPLDLDAGAYELSWLGNTAVMTSPLCRETGLRVIREITLVNAKTVSFRERLQNVTLCPVQKGIWVVTQIPRPFEVLIPSGIEDVRSYFHEDPTLPVPRTEPEVVGDQVKISCAFADCFKYGAIPRKGEVDFLSQAQGGAVLLRHTFSFDPKASYAHRSAVEVYNSQLYPYGEVEIHSPCAQIAPSGEIMFLHEWRLSRI